MQYQGIDRNLLWYHAKLFDENDFDSYMIALKYERPHKFYTPANVTPAVVMKMGNEAAQKTAGMTFYENSKKVKYEKFDRNRFKSLQDAMDLCKAFWKNRAKP